VDTFRGFLGFWVSYSGQRVEDVFAGWLGEYMAGYPEVLEKLVGCLGGLEEVRETMVSRVLPRLDDLIHEVFEGWRAGLEVLREVDSLAAERLGRDLDPIVVLYLGAGCGAGWATRLVEKPAILLDFFNIAELGWTNEEKLRGLIAHEFGHLYHMHLRDEWIEFEEAERDPFFQLYSEGFAQVCEHRILGEESWHPAIGENWLERCREGFSDFAGEYLASAERGDVEAFYGSWLSLRGLKHVGYFLGYELMNWLREKGMSLEEIATLPKREVETVSRRFLREKANLPRNPQAPSQKP